MKNNTLVGFGCLTDLTDLTDLANLTKNAQKHSVNFAVYIANKPNMHEYQGLSTLLPLVQGEIEAINSACGNGWRKVFNVYAKLLFALDKAQFSYQLLAPTWQVYRDTLLLQQNSQTALLFSPPNLQANDNTLHIICGRTYAKALIDKGHINQELIWLDDEFALNKQHKLIICPYFDYRQLSNNKIVRLAQMIADITGDSSRK